MAIKFGSYNVLVVAESIGMLDVACGLVYF